MKKAIIKNKLGGKHLQALLLCHLVLMLCSCVLPTQNRFDDKTKWMEKNFPNRANYLEKIKYDPIFKQAILDGQIKLEMSFDEALVAGEISPYGPNPAGKVFWCNEKLVDSCSAECQDCRAMLVRKRQIHLFETAARGLQIVANYPNNKWPAHLPYHPSSYSAARHILRNEYAPGMNLEDITHVATPPRSDTLYFCGSENQGRNDIPCSANCVGCRAEIHIPGSANGKPRIIELYFNHGVIEHLLQR